WQILRAHARGRRVGRHPHRSGRARHAPASGPGELLHHRPLPRLSADVGPPRLRPRRRAARLASAVLARGGPETAVCRIATVGGPQKRPKVAHRSGARRAERRAASQTPSDRVGFRANTNAVPESAVNPLMKTFVSESSGRSTRQHLIDRLRFILLICAVVASGFAIRELFDNWHGLATQFALRLLGIALAIIALFALKRPWALRVAWPLTI